MLGKATLTPGSLVDPPPARAEQRSPTPTAGRKSPASAVGRRSSTPAASERTLVPVTGGEGSAASAGTPPQTASRPQVNPRAVPLGPSSGGVSVPWARRSGAGKRIMSAQSE